MPRINHRCLSIGVSAARVVERAVAANGGHYCDDPAGALVSSHDEAVEMLQWQEPSTKRFAARFRIDDFPLSTLAWQQVTSTAAIVHQLVNGRAEATHLLLGGQHVKDDAEAVSAAHLLFGHRFPETAVTVGTLTGDVQWVALLLRQDIEGEDAPPETLGVGFLSIVPIFCQLCGID